MMEASERKIAIETNRAPFNWGSISTDQALDVVAGMSDDLANAVRRHRYAQLQSSQNNVECPAKTRWTVSELIQAEFPQPQWVIEGIVPAGLSFLAGRPKLGKSWLALQIAHAVGTGGQLFGKKVELGSVLYLALEDSPSRLKERTFRQQIPASAKIVFETDWKNLPEGGLQELEAETVLNNFRLVIVDTFSRALGGRPDQLDPADMTLVVGGLQRLALSKGFALLVVDHHKKPNGGDSDPIDDILGSTAKAAVADCALGLYRDRSKAGSGSILKLTGRDMEEREIALEWDREICCWQYQGDADQVRKDSDKGRVLQALVAIHEEEKIPTTTKISELTKIDMANVSRCLSALVNEGLVVRGEKLGKQQPYYPAQE